MKEISIEQFEKILPEICGHLTSADPSDWNMYNPLWGHCAIVSVIAQGLFGGTILRASLEGTEFSHARSHYVNRLPGSEIYDFTRAQFGDRYPEGLIFEHRTREYVLSNEDTFLRYKGLAWQFLRNVYADNRLIDSPNFGACFETALNSKCQKMWFGCIVRHRGEIICRTSNATIPVLNLMCEPECIRFKIQSRTESMLGACGHAEEMALWSIINDKRFNIDPGECEFYIAGFHTTGLPWLKTQADHTCLRCALQLYYAKPKSIYVPVVDHWERLNPEEALETAVAYAMKQKTI